MHGLAAQYKAQMLFTYLDIDDPATADLRQALRYRVQPHLFLLDGEGKVVQEWLGFVPQTELEAAFKRVLSE